MEYSYSSAPHARRGTVGLVLVILGLALLLGNWGLLPQLHLWRFVGPGVLIALGGSRLMTPRADGRGRGGLGLLTLGVLLLLSNLHVWAIRQSWPLFLVAAGFAMLWTGMSGRGNDETGVVQ